MNKKHLSPILLTILFGICTVLSIPEYVDAETQKSVVREGTAEAAQYLEYSPKPVVFLLADSRDAAAEYANAELHFCADYSNFTLPLANSMNRELTAAYNRYPELVEELGFLGTNVDVEKYIADSNSYIAEELYLLNNSLDTGYSREDAERDAENYQYSGARLLNRCSNWNPGCAALTTAGHESPFQFANMIVIGRDIAGSYDDLGDLCKKIKQGFYSVNSSGTVLWHELGHLFAGQTGFLETAEFKAYYLAQSSVEITSGLSRYGAADKDEFFAECLSEYHLSANPRRIATEVGKMADNYYEAWKTERRREDIANGLVLTDGQGNFSLLRVDMQQIV